MSADTLAVLLVIGMAPSATLFPIIYGVTAPWWKTLVGWALMISAVGLGLLIDISLAYQWLGDDYALRDVVRLSVFSLILVGTWTQLVALIVELYRGRRHRLRDLHRQ